MDNKFVLNAGFNELVFEKRHKAYGAFQIRKRYSKNVLVSAFVASAIFASAIGSYFIHLPSAVAADRPKDDGPVKIITMTIPHDDKKTDEVKKEKPIVEPPPKGAATKAFTTPQITLKDVITKLVDSSGADPNGKKGGTGVDPVDTGTVGCKDCGHHDPPVPDTIDYASDPPQFPNIDIWWPKNTHYPEPAKEQNIEGTVWLSWIVNTEGKVTDVKVIKGVHPLLDREALRVAKLMPDWIPGKNNGRLVNFLYRKPIHFILSK
ncbi:MAG: TonB family protein [Bacteroidetes bacterium]|nr:TonB family protein [Bacteroidota bacterium]